MRTGCDGGGEGWRCRGNAYPRPSSAASDPGRWRPRRGAAPLPRVISSDPGGVIAVEHSGDSAIPLAISFGKTAQTSNLLVITDEDGHVSLEAEKMEWWWSCCLNRWEMRSRCVATADLHSQEELLLAFVGQQGLHKRSSKPRGLCSHCSCFGGYIRIGFIGLIEFKLVWHMRRRL